MRSKYPRNWDHSVGRDELGKRMGRREEGRRGKGRNENRREGEGRRGIPVAELKLVEDGSSVGAEVSEGGLRRWKQWVEQESFCNQYQGAEPQTF